jgi:hypothetical protein
VKEFPKVDQEINFDQIQNDWMRKKMKKMLKRFLKSLKIMRSDSLTKEDLNMEIEISKISLIPF